MKINIIVFHYFDFFAASFLHAAINTSYSNSSGGIWTYFTVDPLIKIFFNVLNCGCYSPYSYGYIKLKFRLSSTNVIYP